MNAAEPVPSLTGCDREPIHLCGEIQPFGHLIVAVLPDWHIAHLSANCAELFGRAAEDLVGSSLVELVGREVIHDLGNVVNASGGTSLVQRVFGFRLSPDLPPFDVSVHCRSSAVFIELERRLSTKAVQDHLASVQSMLGRVISAASVNEFYGRIAHQVRALTFFDRVMVYRFLEDGSGEVVAEAKRGDLEPFLGLRYPASDIPAQARRLYRDNWVRCIGDAHYEPVAIVPQLDVHGEPLDLSQVGLRSVSAVHRQYLRNMEVSASMSISLIVGGELWGLVACHHMDPSWPTPEQRMLAELFGMLVSMQLESRLRQADFEFERQGNASVDALIGAISTDSALQPALVSRVDELGSLLACDSLALFIDGQWHWEGAALPPEAAAALIRFLNGARANEVYCTHELAARVPALKAHQSLFSGLLAIPVSRRPRDYVLFFRRELRETVRWGGDPNKAAAAGSTAPLTPRNSFATYLQHVTGKSAPWTDAQRRIAMRLRSALLEVVLRYSEAASEERRLASERQDLLIAELNHRVKNLLTLIRSLVTRSRQGAQSLDHFVENLQGRITALSRAHDQIQPGRDVMPDLRELIAAEVTPFRAPGQSFQAHGPSVGLDPGAHTALALVLHELATNAAKYGAFAADDGELKVVWRVDDDGNCILNWEESGGPAVRVPEREGFGSTLIRRIVPFELGGDTQVEYRLTGVHVTLTLPAKYVTTTSSQDDAVPGAAEQPAAQQAPHRLPPDLTVLLLEDNMLIAMETEDALRSLGAARVEVCNTVNQALRVLDAVPVDMAVLDVNLGKETSVPLADQLTRGNVPFVFATAYNDHIMIPERFRSIPVVRKPASDDQLVESIMRAIGR
jgi:light-regulated signal transduction histidine kinase (bacteriophytochrome)